MLEAILLIMPALVAVFVVLFVRKVGPPVEPPNFNEIFDGVSLSVETLVGLGKVTESAGQRILETLINEMTEAGWDTADDSLRDHNDTPFVLQAFKNCGVEITE